MTEVPLDDDVSEGELLYEPGRARAEGSRMWRFAEYVRQRHGLVPPGAGSAYEQLWEWSVEDLGRFWSTLAAFCEVPFRIGPEEVLRAEPGKAEGARWFDGAELNYVDLVLRQQPDSLAIIATDETGRREEVTYGELANLVAQAAAGLAVLGVSTGDRVAAVLPNGLGAVVSFLATASLGAIWSSCAPEFGAASMVDRFRQIEPKVLVAAPAYRYGGKDFDLAPKLEALARALPGTTLTTYDAVLGKGAASAGAAAEPVAVPFSHPLWVLYSSGTTGLPKAIVHGHGGIVLEHLKALSLHGDIGAGERFFWFSTTGWMMWNYLVGGLLTGATIVLYDGSPVHPDPLALWRMAAREHVTFFGTSAPFIESCRKQGLLPCDELEPGLSLSAVRTIGSTGAPLPPEGFAWASRRIGDDVLVGSVSGGTDICTAMLTSCPMLPVHAGELQCASLGTRVEAFAADGTAVVGEVGELVLTTPMPSMPVALWGDPDGSRLHEAYFAHFPGLWRHGDWVKRTPRGSFVVYGRSDATLNRGGVRMGTAEFYRVVETIPGIDDSLVIDTSELGRDGQLVLLVVPSEATDAEAADLEAGIRRALREELSPRHVPDRVVPVRSLPRTLNGKKVEVPIRRIALGTPVEQALSHDSLADPAALDDVMEGLRKAGLL